MPGSTWNVGEDPGRDGEPKVTVGEVLSPRRALTALLLGAIVATAVTLGTGSLKLFPLALWNAGAITLLMLVWAVAWPQDAAGTKLLAEREGRRSRTDTVVLAATFAAFAAVVASLVATSSRRDGISVVIVVMAITATVLSWATVNSVFAFKYARFYYFDVDGGIDFNQSSPPTYADFAYLAFTVGVSFAVSDVQANTTGARRLVLPHALLSYAYTTFMIAVTINLVANLG
jgi:uncharacterized membrane protein